MGASSGMRLLELESFEAAKPAPFGFGRLNARRFLTLLVPLTAAPANRQHGGMGNVLKVLNAFGEQFALKSVLPVADDVGGAVAKSRAWSARCAAFQEEYRTHLRVTGLPGFPRLMGMGSFGGGPVMLMEWVEGCTLAGLHQALSTQNRTWDPHQVRGLGCAVLRILLRAEALPEGFVHRDISMRNIMVRTNRAPLAEQARTGAFDACLIDFGSAAGGLGACDAQLTVQHGIMRHATPEYAPPEMLTDDIPGIEDLRRSSTVDVYALCSVLYQMYAGHSPYRVGLRTAASPYRLKTDFAPEPLAPRTPADTALVQTIMAGLSASQEHRPTPAQLLAVLSS